MRCVFCNDEIKGEVFTTSSGFQIALDIGHNVDSVAKEGRCCEKCNYSIVIPARIRNSNINKMKTVAQQLNHDFSKGPLSLYDSNGNERYWEDSKGYWHKKEYDYNNNRIYYEDSNGTIEDNRPKKSREGATDNGQGKTLQDVVDAVNNWAMTTVGEDDVMNFLNQNK